ncbi:MmgE/PrpD family protein [Bacillus sp. X1(2014)]|uniref:MmgE/PrpD family protein n=1 Tax=Bacillus sp. X1(2014) TaxID=1565991 RepID=UPI001642ECBA|nr:MmgE/PrpD family protein [Bacillus sp. X1(2014)]
MSNKLMGKITQFITETQYSHLPPDLVKLAKLAILDTIGVSLAGWKEPAVEIVKQVYSAETHNPNGSSLWGEEAKINVENAAIINGTASHVLDFDDAAPSVITHPSAPILSAVIPLAEKLASSGKQVITAYSIGTEVMQRLGLIVDLKHYQLGWHSTATLGTIGAAAACSYLYGLNEEESSNAIAISASMAGGLQKNFGTMTKSFHVGLAASLGIQAATLAKHEFTGNPEIFGSRGFLHAFTGGENAERLIKQVESIRFGEPYDLLEAGLAVKKFPCCYATHRFIHGVLSISAEHNIHLEDIEEISLTAPPGGLLPLVHSRPVTGLQGKFSAEYTALAAVADGYIKLSSFENQQVTRPEIQKKLPLIKVSEMEGETKTGQEIENLPVEIQIKTTIGKIVGKQVWHAPGTKSNPLSDTEHREKWVDCLAHYAKEAALPNAGFRAAAAHELYDAGLKIDSYEYFAHWISEIQQHFNFSSNVVRK